MNMFSSKFANATKLTLAYFRPLPCTSPTDLVFIRGYAKGRDDDCRRALVDIPPPVDKECPLACDVKKKKKGILHKIKMKIVEGGTNFGTPFRRLECKDPPCEVVKVPELEALPEPKRQPTDIAEPRDGVQVSILGAETPLGQNVAMLLKQCSCIKKLRLYEAYPLNACCSRSMENIVTDLQHIDTNCQVQAFSCKGCELERCLQNTDIVLMLETPVVTMDMPLERRFQIQAPMVKRYADAIGHECPKAFVVVCTSPIDCMVPLIAETLKDVGWYDPRKILGSLAVPEMRASTLAARALSLEPDYTRVPCVGGTEGLSLVPLFSKAVEFFEFATNNAEMMTCTVRSAPVSVSRLEAVCRRAAELSEAHALAGLVKKVAHALLCQAIQRVTGFVETDAGQIISPAQYIGCTVEIDGSGIRKHLGVPKMNDYEIAKTDIALVELGKKLRMVHEWYDKTWHESRGDDAFMCQFFMPKPMKHIEDCAYANIHFLAIEVLLSNRGICKKFDLPSNLTSIELEDLDVALLQLQRNVQYAVNWYNAAVSLEFERCQMAKLEDFNVPKVYDRLLDCNVHLAS